MGRRVGRGRVQILGWTIGREVERRVQGEVGKGNGLQEIMCKSRPRARGMVGWRAGSLGRVMVKINGEMRTRVEGMEREDGSEAGVEPAAGAAAGATVKGAMGAGVEVIGVVRNSAGGETFPGIILLMCATLHQRISHISIGWKGMATCMIGMAMYMRKVLERRSGMEQEVGVRAVG
jgi:hypothetical protein